MDNFSVLWWMHWSISGTFGFFRDYRKRVRWDLPTYYIIIFIWKTSCSCQDRKSPVRHPCRSRAVRLKSPCVFSASRYCCTLVFFSHAKRKFFKLDRLNIKPITRLRMCSCYATPTPSFFMIVVTCLSIICRYRSHHQINLEYGWFERTYLGH